jgi:hypothetical protein
VNTKLMKTALAAAVVALGLGARASQAATVIAGGTSAVVDGWNISAPIGISLAVDNSSGSELYIEKVANFTSPVGGLIITFDQVSAGAAAQIDLTDESVTNNTGSAFSGFQFLVLNTTSSLATFDGLGNVFVPPTGTNVDYTTVTLDSTKTVLTYTGTQANGAISNWGSSLAGDNLLIDADPAAGSPYQDFGLKELPNTGGGGGTPVPLPAAAWQSLAGLAGLGLLAIGRKVKKASHRPEGD